MVDIVKGGGGVPPQTSPGWANFPIMIGMYAIIWRCHSMCTLWSRLSAIFLHILSNTHYHQSFQGFSADKHPEPYTEIWECCLSKQPSHCTLTIFVHSTVALIYLNGICDTWGGMHSQACYWFSIGFKKMVCTGATCYWFLALIWFYKTRGFLSLEHYNRVPHCPKFFLFILTIIFSQYSKTY